VAGAAGAADFTAAQVGGELLRSAAQVGGELLRSLLWER
jgi:hypothetical protein